MKHVAREKARQERLANERAAAEEQMGSQGDPSDAPQPVPAASG
jgi:hypothetical protein